MSKIIEFINIIKDYRNNITTFEETQKKLYTEYEQTFKQIKLIDESYFEKIDKELNGKNLYFKGNMLIDKNIYTNFMTYKDYAEKILKGIEINDSLLTSLSQTLILDITIIKMTSLQIQKLINSYEFKSTDNKITYPSKYFNDKMIYEKIDDTLMNINLGDFYNICNTKTSNNIINYELKWTIKDKIKKIKKKLFDYVDKYVKGKKPDFNISDGDFDTINAIFKSITYTILPTINFGGGHENLQTGGNTILIDNNKKIKHALSIQQQLINKINKIEKNISLYFSLLYEIYFYILFVYGEPKNRTYSLLVFDIIEYDLIDKWFNSIKAIPNLKFDKYKILVKIIEKYFKDNISKYNIETNKHLRFVLLIDKFNALLRDYNDTKINFDIESQYNKYSIFLLGNRTLLEEFYVLYKITSTVLLFNQALSVRQIISIFIYYFLLSNLHLINTIKHVIKNGEEEIVLKKMDDIMFNFKSQYYDDKYINWDHINLKINDKYMYHFVNYDIASKDFIKNLTTTNKKYIYVKFL